MDTSFIKELYFREIERKQEFDSAPGVPIAVLTVVGGVFTFYLKSFLWIDTVLSLLFGVLLLVAGVFAVLTVVWIIRSYIGAEYEYLPYADELFGHYNDLQGFFDDAKAASEDFTADLRVRMVEATTANQYNNNRRSELLFGTKRFLAGLVVATLLAAIPPGVEWLLRNTSKVPTGGPDVEETQAPQEDKAQDATERPRTERSGTSEAEAEEDPLTLR
jgi:hypothetical protein